MKESTEIRLEALREANRMASQQQRRPIELAAEYERFLSGEPKIDVVSVVFDFLERACEANVIDYPTYSKLASFLEFALDVRGNR